MATSRAMLTSSLCGSSLPLRQAQRASRSGPMAARQIVCRAEQDAQPGAMPKLLSVPMAAALAGLMLTSAMTPDEALAARSGGRVGGSSFKSAPRAAPRSAPRGGGGGGAAVRGGNTYNTYSVAPPVYGGGYGGFGGFGGGLSFFPRPYFPVFGVGLPIGGFFNFIFTMFVITTIFGVVRGALSKGNNNRRRDDEDWD